MILSGLALEVPIVTGDLERGLVRLGAAGGVVDVVQVAGEELSQFGGQLDRRRGGEAEEGRHEGDFVDLIGRGHRQLMPAVADVDIPEPGEGVDVLLAVGVPEVDALAAGEHERATLADLLEVGDRVEKVGLVLRDQIGRVPGLYDRHERASFLALPRR